MRTQKLLKGLLVFALVLHILSAVAVFALKPESISTTPDPLDYRLAALNIIDYHIFSLAPPSYHAPQLLRTPVYPALLAGTYLIDGRTGFAMILLQSILLIIMGWLLFKILCAFEVTEHVALLLTAFYLFEPLQWLYTLQTMTETVASFLLMLLLAGIFLGKGIWNIPNAALFGVGLGLLVLEKPSATMWVPFLLILLLAVGTDAWRARLVRAGIVIILFLATLSPWMIRNYELTGHFIVSSSGPFNFIAFAGTPATVHPEYFEPVTHVTYNGGHSNETWYAYTTNAYPMLLATQHDLLEHADYISLITQQIAVAPSVWFGNIVLQHQESYGHEYSMIADFVVHPNQLRDTLLNITDTVIWTLLLFFLLVGTGVLVRTSATRWRFVPLFAILLATVFINFRASWVRVLLPIYPVIVIGVGIGIDFLLKKMRTVSSPSLLRRAEHDALSTSTLSGKVVDLGGDSNGEYLTYFKGTFSTTAVNMDTDTAPEVFHDLEKPLPFPNHSFDHALLINVLEHIFDYRQLLSETVRIVKPNGSVIIAVPFLFPIHPSPNDYWRYSKQTLEKECAHAGLTITKLIPLGTGVFSVRYVLLDRLMPSPIRLIAHYTLRYVTLALDKLFTATAHMLGKRYDPSEYALGYIVHAKRN